MTADLSGIRYLQIEPTTRCNLSCGFCAGRSMPRAELSLETFRASIELLPNLEHVELQGEGEPLLHAGFLRMVSWLRETRPGVRVSFITNGTVLDERCCEKLVALGVNRILVSMDSTNAEQYRAIRGGNLGDVLDGLHKLLRARTEHQDSTTQVGLAVVALRSTLSGLPRIAELYNALGLDGGAVLQPLQRMAGYMSHYPEDMRREMLPPRAVRRLWRWVYATPLLREVFARSPSGIGFYQGLQGPAPEPGICPWLVRGLYVSAGGKAMSCCHIKDDHHALGDVSAESAGSVLTRRAALAATLAEGNIPEQCRGCTIAHRIVQPF